MDIRRRKKSWTRGLKLIQAKEEYQGRLVELRREIQVGMDQINRGEVLDGKVVFENLRGKLQARQS